MEDSRLVCKVDYETAKQRGEPQTPTLHFFTENPHGFLSDPQTQALVSLFIKVPDDVMHPKSIDSDVWNVSTQNPFKLLAHFFKSGDLIPIGRF